MTEFYIVTGVIFGLDMLIVGVLWRYTSRSNREKRRSERSED